jgi:hypothetical protein
MNKPKKYGYEDLKERGHLEDRHRWEDNIKMNLKVSEGVCTGLIRFRIKTNVGVS